MNTAIRILGDRQRAQDVHQEVFLKILQRWHKCDGKTYWKGYLYRTTVRAALEFADRRKIEPFNERSSGCFSTNENPHELVKAAEFHEKLMEYVRVLPKRQADVFTLSKVEGLKNEEISEILGCSQKTIRVHLHRAIKYLADRLKDYLS